MRDHEDVSAQAEAKTNAELDLRAALARLSQASKAAAKSLRLDEVYAAHRAVQRFEEALDIATLDLATARGEDA